MEERNQKECSKQSDKTNEDVESPKAEKPLDGAVDIVFCSRCGHAIVAIGPHVICGFCGARVCPSCG